MNIRTVVTRAAMILMLATATASAVAQNPLPDNATQSGPAASQTTSTTGARAARKANRQLVKRVSEVLARTRGLDSTRILVSAKNGVVTLSGTTTDSVQAGLAVAAAQQVQGVLMVKNQLRINTQN
jgi:hyperosmotically inducible periplasmic protein